MKILAILFLSILSLQLGCGGSPDGGPSGGVNPDVKRVWEADGSVVPIARDVQQTTPKGVHVFSRKGLSQEHLTQADEALTELFGDAQAAFPDQVDPIAYRFDAYFIYEPDHDCKPSPVQGVPGFYVKDSALQYDESQYDQYPGVGRSVIIAPERIFGFTTNGSTPRAAQMIVCPDLRYWKNGVRYGGEHNVAESGYDGSAILALAGSARTHTTVNHPFIPSR